MTGDERPLFYGSLGASLLLHLVSVLFFWKVQIPAPDLRDPTPLMVRLLPASEVPRFIDQPEAPPAAGPVKSKDISQVTSTARGPGKIPGPVTTPQSSGTPRLPVRPEIPGQQQLARPPTPPPPPPQAKAEGSQPTPPRPVEKMHSMTEQSPPEKPGAENAPETTITTTPRPSLREQIAALGSGRLSREGSPFDPGRSGMTGTGERTVSLETQSSEFAPYLAVVKHRIERQWRIPPYAIEVGLTGKLVLVFGITTEGHLAQVQIQKSSGVSILDDAAIEAVRTAAPYAPFPSRFSFRQLNIVATFEYVASTAPFQRSP